MLDREAGGFEAGDPAVVGRVVDPEGDVPGPDDAVRGDPPSRLIADAWLEDEQDGVWADAVAEREGAIARNVGEPEDTVIEGVGRVKILGIEDCFKHAADRWNWWVHKGVIHPRSACIRQNGSPETMSLMTQTYILIGGGGGIGSAVTRRLKNRGATVIIAERNADKAETKARELGAIGMHCDATDFEQVADLVTRVVGEHGPVDGIANLAGSIVIKPVTSISQDEFLETIHQNLTSAFATVRAASRPMQKAGKGSIVLMSSCAARLGLMHHEAIAAAKGGVISLAQTAAASMAAKGVRVNCVAPGLVDTPMAARLTGSDRAREASEQMHPLGRLGEPEDIAAAIEWLITDDSSWVTGQCVGVDGGLAAIKGK